MICTMFAPWMGQLSFYSGVFLHCCSLAKKIQWIIHSDQPAPENLPDNIVWLPIGCVTSRIRRVYNLAERGVEGHKLCDLKPYWHLIFDDGFEDTKFIGFIDWDVVHDLSSIKFDFESAKFTAGWMTGPLFIQQKSAFFEYYPLNFGRLLEHNNSVRWDEGHYLPLLDSTILQQGMTPEIDLFSNPKYAVHLYKGKSNKDIYKKHLKKYLPESLNGIDLLYQFSD